MPEGPEIYRAARKLSRAIGNQPLVEVWFAFEHLKPWSGQLTGQHLKVIETLGKALLLRFADETTIYTHNQLYGRWMVSDADRRPDTTRQLRLALSTERRSALLYSASDIQVIEAGKLLDHPFIARAGLDILSSAAGPDAIADWVRRPGFAGRRLGNLLLDQGFLAGVGNYLRSEILYLAGLHWQRRPADLDDAAIYRLASAAHTLMWRSVETGGIVNEPERAERLKKAGWSRSDYRFYVFDRDGQACHRCNATIVRLMVTQRRLYHCPNCQPG